MLCNDCVLCDDCDVRSSYAPFAGSNKQPNSLVWALYCLLYEHSTFAILKENPASNRTVYGVLWCHSVYFKKPLQKQLMIAMNSEMGGTKWMMWCDMLYMMYFHLGTYLCTYVGTD